MMTLVDQEQFSLSQQIMARLPLFQSVVKNESYMYEIFSSVLSRTVIS